MIDLPTAVRRIGAKVASMVSRGIVSRVDDSKPTQVIQIKLRADEVADLVEHLQPWGLSFHPTPDSEVVILAVGGEQKHLVALNATNRSHRPTGASEGEGGLYTPSGWKVYLDKNDRTNLGAKQASQSGVRGEDIKSALDTFASDVATAVSGITYAGTGSVSSSAAAAQLQSAAQKLSTALQNALSDKVKIE